MEYQLIQRCIEVAFTEALLRRHEDRRPLTIPAFHITFAAIQQRLQQFAGIVHVLPQVVEKLTSFMEDNPGNPLNTEREMAVDVAGLYLALEELTPALADLGNANSRGQWMQPSKASVATDGGAKTSKRTMDARKPPSATQSAEAAAASPCNDFNSEKGCHLPASHVGLKRCCAHCKKVIGRIYNHSSVKCFKLHPAVR
jgi:hypothetical protein